MLPGSKQMFGKLLGHHQPENKGGFQCKHRISLSLAPGREQVMLRHEYSPWISHCCAM